MSAPMSADEASTWTLVLGRRHLERTLGTYVRHDNEGRPHRGRGLRPPAGPPPRPITDLRPASVRRRDLLGGLIHEYEVAA
jgi:putative transposase